MGLGHGTVGNGEGTAFLLGTGRGLGPGLLLGRRLGIAHLGHAARSTTADGHGSDGSPRCDHKGRSDGSASDDTETASTGSLGEHDLDGKLRLGLRLGSLLGIPAAGLVRGKGHRSLGQKTLTNEVRIDDTASSELIHDGTDTVNGTLLGAKEGGRKAGVDNEHTVVGSVALSAAELLVDGLDRCELTSVALTLKVDNGRDGQTALIAGEGLDVSHLDVVRGQLIVVLGIGGKANAKLEGVTLGKEGIIEGRIVHARIVGGALTGGEGVFDVNQLGGLLGLVTLNANVSDSEILSHVDEDGRLELLVGDGLCGKKNKW